MDGAPIQGLKYLAVEVADLDAAESFYADGLGMVVQGRDSWPGERASVELSAGDQRLFLVRNPGWVPALDGGTHQAYRFPPSAREDIIGRLKAQGAAIETYMEERPAEAGDNLYAFDPAGNRVQLVMANNGGGKSVTGIDHACVEDYDLQWSETFYAHILGLPVEYWHGLRTDDYLHAQDWSDGRRPLAPGSCRMVRYYRQIPGQNRMQPRPTLQVYLRAGDNVVGIYMAMDDYAEPPEEQLCGSPCLAFAVAPGGLDGVARALEDARRPFIGPVAAGADAPLGATLYCRDTGGNFLAFTESE